MKTKFKLLLFVWSGLVPWHLMAAGIIESHQLSDGTELGCYESDENVRWLGIKTAPEYADPAALDAKTDRLNKKRHTYARQAKRAATRKARTRARQKLQRVRNLLRQIEYYENICEGNTAPTPTPLPDGPALIANHTAVSSYDNIPSSVFDQIRNNFRIFYGHTSHGSQVLTGLQLVAGIADPPILNVFHEEGGDLGHSGDLSWVQPTRDFLNVNPEYNTVMWSWCGGVSDNTSDGIDTYLSAMNQLEQDFPSVTFVYMTGHLDGSGENGNLREMNRQIREYALNNAKVLFDFEDIESWDPDGHYYPDASDACEWCSTWCSIPGHSCPSAGAGDCAHSHLFNCYQKGKAWWWMMARLSGWGA